MLETPDMLFGIFIIAISIYAIKELKNKIAIILIAIIELIAFILSKGILLGILVETLILLIGFSKSDNQTKINIIILLVCGIVFCILKFTLFMYLFGHCTECSFESGIDFSRKENALAMGFDSTDVTFVGLILSSAMTYITTIKHLKKVKSTKVEIIVSLFTITYITFTSLAFNRLTEFA